MYVDKDIIDIYILYIDIYIYIMRLSSSIIYPQFRAISWEIIQQSNMMTNMWICICPVIFGQQKPCRSGSHQKSQNIPPSSHTLRGKTDVELHVQVADGWIVIEMSPSRAVFGCGYKQLDMTKRTRSPNMSIALVLRWFPPMKRLPSRKPTVHYGSHGP